jgi:prefoldin subunit 5
VGAEGDIATLREQIASLRRDLDRIEAKQSDLLEIKIDVADFKKLRASINFLWASFAGAVIAGIVAYGLRVIGA